MIDDQLRIVIIIAVRSISIIERSKIKERVVKQDDLPDIMTAAEVAKYLRTTTGNLAQDRYLGRGIPFVKYGKRVRYRRSDVLAFVDANLCTRTDLRRGTA